GRGRAVRAVVVPRLPRPVDLLRPLDQPHVLRACANREGEAPAEPRSARSRRRAPPEPGNENWTGHSCARQDGWPTVVGISPASMSCLRRGRAARICCSGADWRKGATAAPTLPAGGSYLSTTRTTVPRSPGAGSKWTEPAVSPSEPASDRQAIVAPGRS